MLLVCARKYSGQSCGGLRIETRDAHARRRRDEDWTLTAPILNPDLRVSFRQNLAPRKRADRWRFRSRPLSIKEWYVDLEIDQVRQL
jgi:hypothetical protein